MALFIIYSDSQTGRPKTVLRYGECPDDHVSSQANTGEIAVAVSEAQTGNFIGAAAIVEDPPETGGASEAAMLFNSDTGAVGFSLSSSTSSAREVNATRRQLLADSDWTQLADAPIDAGKKIEWQVYRQALRDIPSQSGFPGSVNWPVQPT